MKKHLTLSILILSLDCSTDQTNTEKGTKAPTKISYPIQPLFIDSSEEEGWGADIRLSITEITSNDSLITYKAISSHEGKDVGIEFILPAIKQGIENSPTQMLTIRSCGESSDNLLALVSKLYKLKIEATSHFISSAFLAFVDLNEFAKTKFGKDAIPDTDAKEMKVFFEAEDPEGYAELYVNINSKGHWLELREKDQSYRSQVIRFLSRK
jgi:hypothetical protein